ncbi:MAG: C_GCAxxG_C_C family protein [Selenomonadaceae bacterium]|nr:C_GCAxxG_C_C family protein [Selenomonadaceae bacterium]MBQ6131032.1 C_GCAxxG_C_C family protein [Selenomonadaceae bacterium]
MSDRINLANELHRKGYSCSQSVAVACADLIDVPKEILFRAAEGFGAGMGTMDGVCGALTGGLLIAGLKNSTGDLDNPKSKASTMKISRAMLTSFREKSGAIICRELKGVDTGKMICSCPDCIKHGVEVVEENLT